MILSETAEFLLGALYGLQTRLCPDCAGKMKGCELHEMVKATKELILHGAVLVDSALCSACQRVGMVARLRQPRW